MAASVAKDAHQQVPNHDREALWLGIDLGTTSVKVALMDDDGGVMRSVSYPTLANLESDIGSSGFEQSPQKILITVQGLILPLIEEHIEEIKGIGITGQMHGVVMWKNSKEEGQEVTSFEKINAVCSSHLYTWQDQRCSPEFLDTLPATSSQDQPLSSGHGCATMFWLEKNRPSFFQDGQFTSCGTIMDYLVAILCDLEHPVTSDQLAASMGYFDRNSLAWDAVLHETKDFPDHLLPKVVQAGKQVGHVSGSLKGWPSGAPVYVGMGDVQCAMYAVFKEAQDAVVNISTSVQLGFVVPHEEIETVRKDSPPSISFFPYFQGHHLALCAGLNAGSAIHFFAECITNWFSDLGLDSNINPTSLLPKLQQLAEKEARKQQESRSSLEIRPVFFGERHDLGATGHIKGITSANFNNIGQVFQTTCEGLVDHLHSMVPSKYLLSRSINKLLVSGSVPMNNLIVRQRLMHVYGSGKKINVVMDRKGNDAVGSAIGAAKVAKDFAVR